MFYEVVNYDSIYDTLVTEMDYDCVYFMNLKMVLMKFSCNKVGFVMDQINGFGVDEFSLWLLYMRINRFNDDEFSIWLLNELTALSESSLSKLWLIKNVDEFYSWLLYEFKLMVMKYFIKMSESKIKPDVKAKAEGKTKLVKAKSSPNHSPAMDMIKAAIKSSQDRTRIPFLRRALGHGEDNQDDGKLNMVLWADLENNINGPSCSWVPRGGQDLVRNPLS